MIGPTVAASLLDAYYRAPESSAAGAWRAYVRAVRAAVNDPNAPPEMAAEAKRIVEAGIDEDDPPDRHEPDAEDA